MIGEAAWAVLAVCAIATAIWSGVREARTARLLERAVALTEEGLAEARWWKGQAEGWKDEALRTTDEDAAPADGPLAVVWRRER
jgi:hypothetical protein